MENLIEDKNSMELMLMYKRSLLSKSKLATISRSREGTRFTCVECSAQYDDKEKLELHLFSHYHAYRFLCGVCGTGLKRKEHLDRHMQEHTEYRPHVCPECGKAFKRKEHLNIHSSIHKGKKNLACSICHKTFYRKDHLQKHLQTHNKHFMEVNINPVSDQELDIKQEVDDCEELSPIITSVKGNAHVESSTEVCEVLHNIKGTGNKSMSIGNIYWFLQIFNVGWLANHWFLQIFNTFLPIPKVKRTGNVQYVPVKKEDCPKMYIVKVTA